MTKTAIRKGRKALPLVGLKAVGDPADGIFEAYVSIFGNVDYHGDRILPGAFAGSLSRWEASGDPIPVIFSHQWDDLDAHIGEVLAAEEHPPGDERLPAEIKANGGLWTRFQLDMDEDFASRVAKRLTKRRLREFSFAYDVLDEKRGSDGANELVELEIIEVGPTLKGANPATVLLAKALGDGTTEVRDEQLVEILGKFVAHAFAPGDEDASRCVLCGMTRNTVAHNALGTGADGTKARVAVTFEGSAEETLDELYAAGVEWARGLDVGAGGFYYLHQEATYPDEMRAVVMVEGWEDPVGEGIFYELTYERAEDGSVSVKDASEIEVTVELSRKARARKARAKLVKGTTVTVTVDDPAAPEPAPSPASEPDPDDDEDEGGDDDPEADAAVLAELDELVLSDLDPAPTE